MAIFKQGVYTANEGAYAPVAANPGTAGIPLVVGAAPAWQAGANASYNQIVRCENFGEAQAVFGYSDDFEKYPISEAMYVFFTLAGISPVYFINVLDPAGTPAAFTDAAYNVDANGVLYLPANTVKTGIVIKIGEDDDEQTLVSGTDYTVGDYEAKGLAVSFKNIVSAAVKVSGTKIPDAVTASAIIGADDGDGNKTGLCLADAAFTLYGENPDILLAPGFGADPTVQAALIAHCSLEFGFAAKTVIVADGNSPTAAAKPVRSKYAICAFPARGAAPDGSPVDKDLDVAAAMVLEDARHGGVPCGNPLNKAGVCVGNLKSDRTPMYMDLTLANKVAAKGMGTSFYNGTDFVFWSAYTTAYPQSEDNIETSISEGRMFDYIANTVIRSSLPFVGANISRRTVDACVNSINTWLDGLVASGKLFAGRVEFPADLNSADSMRSGKMNFRIILTTFPTATEINYVLTYDAAALTAVFNA